MAKGDRDKDEVIVNVPLRRLMTGVPRTKRANAAIPRIKRFVLRHVDPKWLEATEGPSPMREHRVLIDDFLNETIWRRGREHIAGPEVWVKSRDAGKRRLVRKTAVRYGSVLKVKVLFVENPVDGGEARLEIYLPGYEDVKEEREGRRKVVEGEEEGEGDEEGDESEDAEKGEAADPDEQKAEADEPKTQKPAAVKPVRKAPKADDKKEAKPKEEKSTTKSAAAKGAKEPAGKAEVKKAAPKAKKEGGD
jgi:ribosomal protein L31E